MTTTKHLNDNIINDDDDDDVVVLQVCAHCRGIDDLEFDTETNESYCRFCRDLFRLTKYEGFRILLNNDDLALVSLIFSTLDKGKKGFWDYKDWREFQKYTGHSSAEEIDTSDALSLFFKEEYDLDLRKKGNNGAVIHLVDLENMYGGYAYNHINALTEDSMELENEGIINTGVLE
ncbi:unnamed protein product [Phytomonas sp. Hart1]|nr:unnamed protein product [Phytomonas sp. Hart1]|eukprot:CCW68990.1 unnamed protein product [Phytomonas sp. isolate Hart1]